MSEPIQLTYLFDPLCGWCYGAGPAVAALMAAEGVSIEIAPTGLFSGPGAFAMTAEFAAHVWSMDQRVAQMTGQEYSTDYRRNILQGGRGMVDSSAATLALTAVHLTAPEREFEALRAIQHARYVGGRDNGTASVIASVLGDIGLTAAHGRLVTPDEELLAANAARMDAAQSQLRRFGARGVPTLIAAIGDQVRMVDSAALYGDANTLIATLRAA